MIVIKSIKALWKKQSVTFLPSLATLKTACVALWDSWLKKKMVSRIKGFIFAIDSHTCYGMVTC